MVQVATLRRRSWGAIAWLLIIGTGLLAALTFGNTMLLLVVLLSALLSGGLLLRGQSLPQAAPAPVLADADTAIHVQRAVVTADGTLRQAQVVPATTISGYETVLTIDGYALINAEGRIVYALNRASHAPASEPVVVTILDAEEYAR